MMKTSIFLLSKTSLLLFFLVFSFVKVQSQISCGTDEIRKELMKDPIYRSLAEDNEAKIQKIIQANNLRDFDDTEEKTY